MINMTRCPYCKHSKESDFLRVKEIKPKDIHIDARTIVILMCSKCGGMFFVYEHLLKLSQSKNMNS